MIRFKKSLTVFRNFTFTLVRGHLFHPTIQDHIQMKISLQKRGTAKRKGCQLLSNNENVCRTHVYLLVKSLKLKLRTYLKRRRGIASAKPWQGRAKSQHSRRPISRSSRSVSIASVVFGGCRSLVSPSPKVRIEPTAESASPRLSLLKGQTVNVCRTPRITQVNTGLCY